MSVIAHILLMLLLLLTFSQFGSRLSARHALSWWAMSLFILVAGLAPQLLIPITELLGIQVVSNFVLAALVLFLFLQLFDLTSDTSLQGRKLRLIVARLAADDYVKKQSLRIEDNTKKTVLVALPCFNEEKALPQTLGCLKTLIEQTAQHPKLDINFCFINDGSIDRSEQILKSISPSSFTSHRANIGVAGVLLTGFEISKLMDIDYLVQCDSDGQHPVEIIPRLVETAMTNHLDLLIGSRFARQELLHNEVKTRSLLSDESTTRLRILGIQVIRICLGLFGGQAKILDPTSGFRVYSRYARDILMTRMPDEYPEPESIAILALNGARIAEFKVRMLPRETGVSSLQGLKTIRYMMKVITALLGLRLRSMRG
jgi:hypothetical protein